LAHAGKLMADGADALDVGAASSNPRSKGVPPEVEIARLKPVVARARKKGWKISVDSFGRETQAWAIENGADYINDIQGFPFPEFYPDVAGERAKLIVMHNVQGLGRAKVVPTDPATIIGRIADFFDARIAALTAAGVARSRLILDPGMGLFVGNTP